MQKIFTSPRLLIPYFRKKEEARKNREAVIKAELEIAAAKIAHRVKVCRAKLLERLGNRDTLRRAREKRERRARKRASRTPKNLGTIYDLNYFKNWKEAREYSVQFEIDSCAFFPNLEEKDNVSIERGTIKNS